MNKLDQAKEELNQAFIELENAISNKIHQIKITANNKQNQTNEIVKIIKFDLAKIKEIVNN